MKMKTEKKLKEAWELLQGMKELEQNSKPEELAADPEYVDPAQRVRKLVTDPTADWLRSLPNPPQGQW
jgi:hypothetical protein